MFSNLCNNRYAAATHMIATCRDATGAHLARQKENLVRQNPSRNYTFLKGQRMDSGVAPRRQISRAPRGPDNPGNPGQDPECTGENLRAALQHTRVLVKSFEIILLTLVPKLPRRRCTHALCSPVRKPLLDVSTRLRAPFCTSH